MPTASRARAASAGSRPAVHVSSYRSVFRTRARRSAGSQRSSSAPRRLVGVQAPERGLGPPAGSRDRVPVPGRIRRGLVSVNAAPHRAHRPSLVRTGSVRRATCQISACSSSTACGSANTMRCSRGVSAPRRRQDALDQRGARGTDLRPDAAGAPQQRPVQRVDVRVDDRAHEPVLLRRRQRGRAASAASWIASRSRSSGGGAVSSGIRNSPSGARASPRLTRLASTETGIDEHERADDRRHPPEVVGVEPVEADAPGAREERVEAVVADRLAPAGLGVLARPASATTTVRPIRFVNDEAAVERPCGSAPAGSRARSRARRSRAGGRRRRRPRACAVRPDQQDARASSAGRGSRR